MKKFPKDQEMTKEQRIPKGQQSMKKHLHLEQLPKDQHRKMNHLTMGQHRSLHPTRNPILRHLSLQRP